MQAKKRVVKDYDKLPEEVINRIKVEYPKGFVKHLIKYTNAQGQQVSALPYETEDMYYLIRMSISEARQIILDDDDYEDGVLRDGFEDDMDDDGIITDDEKGGGSFDEPFDESNEDDL